MTILHFEGHSDDTFGEYNHCHIDHSNIDQGNKSSGRPIVFRVAAGEESMVVYAQCCPEFCGGWMIGVSHDGATNPDEKDLPAWSMRFEASERTYSPRLVIEAPDDVAVFLVTE